MINEFYEKLASIAVNYSLRVKKGQRVYIAGPALAKELFQALYIEILKVGGHPLLLPQIEGISELYYKYASEEQLLYVDKVQKMILKEFDHYVVILGDYNTRKLSQVNPEIISKSQGSPDRREIFEILEERMSKKELGYLVLPFPSNSLAQEANMDLFSYINFIKNALFLEKENPIDEWNKLNKKQEKIIKYLKNVKEIHVMGEDTDLYFSVEDRVWKNSSGNENLPDGEVYTSPLEDSANGHIRFTYPGIFQGREIENIFLRFKEGKIIETTADKGEDLLKEILKIENANRIGEFAIGNNYGITKFTKNMLFDEKIGGTLHFALGLGFMECGSKNKSAIHWDILKDMKFPGSRILADGKVIYEEGQWKI
ncbi:MAG: aminopeptidase [Promethearchaeota archaeon]